jgi:methyl-accepting chemotaxis protein
MKANTFFFALCMAILLAAPSAYSQSRATSPAAEETGRDSLGFRRDKVTKETIGERHNSPSTPTTKQAMEDFTEIQKINRNILTASKEAPLAFEKIAEDAKQISNRASRLKASLSLPSPPKQPDKAEIALASSTEDLMSQIKELDANVKAFVTNPMFRSVRQADKDVSTEASDASLRLHQVIELSRVLQRSADKLRREAGPK